MQRSVLPTRISSPYLEQPKTRQWAGSNQECRKLTVLLVQSSLILTPWWTCALIRGDAIDDKVESWRHQQLGHLNGMNTQARMVRLPQFVDTRGVLTVAEGPSLPFHANRFFTISEAPPGALRGGHAHRRCHELIVAVHGSFKLTLIDRRGRDEIVLSTPDVAVHVPPMVWLEQSEFAAHTVVFVLASDPYDPADYIRSLDELITTTL